VDAGDIDLVGELLPRGTPFEDQEVLCSIGAHAVHDVGASPRAGVKRDPVRHRQRRVARSTKAERQGNVRAVVLEHDVAARSHRQGDRRRRQHAPFGRDPQGRARVAVVRRVESREPLSNEVRHGREHEAGAELGQAVTSLA
jgi:hypothetical protein